MKKMNFGTTKTAAILRDNSNREGKADWMAEEQSLNIKYLTKPALITTTIGSQDSRIASNRTSGKMV